jgi:hypothetical protein
VTEVVTGCLIGLATVLVGFLALHAYAAWSIRDLDRDRRRALELAPTNPRPKETHMSVKLVGVAAALMAVITTSAQRTALDTSLGNRSGGEVALVAG